MVIVPFSNNKKCNTIHSILVPFLFFHWLTNNDTCILTELEKMISKKEQNKDTFIGSILSPVYIINDCTSRKLTKMTTLLLWCFSLNNVLV